MVGHAESTWYKHVLAQIKHQPGSVGSMDSHFRNTMACGYGTLVGMLWMDVTDVFNDPGALSLANFLHM